MARAASSCNAFATAMFSSLFINATRRQSGGLYVLRLCFFTMNIQNAECDAMFQAANPATANELSTKLVLVHHAP